MYSYLFSSFQTIPEFEGTPIDRGMEVRGVGVVDEPDSAGVSGRFAAWNK